MASDALSNKKPAIKTLSKLQNKPEISHLVGYFKNHTTNNSLLASLLFANDEIEPALKSANRSLEKSPDNLEMIFLKAQCLERLYQDNDALRLLTTSLSLLPIDNSDHDLRMKGQYYAFIAHLTEDREDSKNCWQQALQYYEEAGDIINVGRVNIELRDKRKLDDAIQCIEESVEKADLISAKAEIDFSEEKYSVALNGFQLALKIHKKFEDFDGSSIDHYWIAKCFEKQDKLRNAEKHALLSKGTAKMGSCWKTYRSAMILLASIYEEQKKFSKMSEELLEAEKLSTFAEDHEFSKKISEMREHKDQMALFKKVGIVDADGKIQKETVAFVGAMMDHHYTPEEMIKRLKANNFRNIILESMAGNADWFGHSADEAGQLFKSLGFSHNISDVDIDKFEKFYKKYQEVYEGLEHEDLSRMNQVRLLSLDTMKSEPLSSEMYWTSYAVFLRGGFSFDNPLAYDLDMYRLETQRLELVALGQDNSLISSYVTAWANAKAQLNDDTILDKYGANVVVDTLGDNPIAFIESIDMITGDKK